VAERWDVSEGGSCGSAVRRQTPCRLSGLTSRQLESAPKDAIAAEAPGDDPRRGRGDPCELGADRSGQGVPARMADRSAQGDGAGIEQGGRGGQAQCDPMSVGLLQRRRARDLRLGICCAELGREVLQGLCADRRLQAAVVSDGVVMAGGGGWGGCGGGGRGGGGVRGVGMYPICPAAPVDPRSGAPSTWPAYPRPVPIHSTPQLCRFCVLPATCSAAAASSTSRSSVTGHGSAERSVEI